MKTTSEIKELTCEQCGGDRECPMTKTIGGGTGGSGISTEFGG